MITNEGQILDYNEKFIELWRLPREVMESRDEETARRVAMEQLVDPMAAFAESQQMIHGDKEGKGTCTDLHFKDGRICERYSQPYRVGDQIVGRVWSMRDVTESRRSEAALKLHQRAIAASPDGIMLISVKNEGHPIIYTNPAFKEITGYDTSDVIGQEYNFLYDKDDKQPEIEKIKYAMNQGEDAKVVMRSYRKDGSMFWGEIHLAPVFQRITDIDTQGGVFTDSTDSRKEVEQRLDHYVFILVDVTERKAMEKQLTYQATHDGLTNRHCQV
ncbi:MAG: PAS domain-containing protein [Gammaproteobacteria bacterium]|nr:PAS domain-containing protein [Gammaproteobacteria bacterium]